MAQPHALQAHRREEFLSALSAFRNHLQTTPKPMAVNRTAPSFCSAGIASFRPGRADSPQHGAQGRVQDDRHFSGRPQGLSLTGRAPCDDGCGDGVHRLRTFHVIKFRGEGLATFEAYCPPPAALVRKPPPILRRVGQIAVLRADMVREPGNGARPSLIALRHRHQSTAFRPTTLCARMAL